MGSAHNWGEHARRYFVNRAGVKRSAVNAETIRALAGWSAVELITAGAETRVVADPLGVGQRLLIRMDTDGGDCVLTFSSAFDKAGNTTLTFDDTNDWAEFVGVEDSTADTAQASKTFAWRLVASDGVTVDAVNFADNEYLNLGDSEDVGVRWNGTYLEAGPKSGFWAGCPSPADPSFIQIATVFEDDFNYDAPLDANLRWLEIDDSGTGTNALQDAANGVGSIITAAADNDYHAISSLGEVWKFVAGKKLWAICRFKVAEAATNQSAWWFGLTDTLTTGGFQDDADGPLASYDGALIWKDEATMAIDFETSNAGTQATTTNMATFVTDTWTTVAFYFDGTATTSVVTPYYNVAGTNALTAGTPQNITLSGLDEMHLVLGVKAGPGGGAETLQVDFVKVVQLR